MKLKHWMESLSRARKKSKADNNSSAFAPAPPTKDKSSRTTTKKFFVKENMMPNNAPRERKHVRDNYPAVAAYLDHRNPLASIQQNLRTFRPTATAAKAESFHYFPPSCHLPATTTTASKAQKSAWKYQRMSEDAIYDMPSKAAAMTSLQECACYRHQQLYAEKIHPDPDSFMDDSVSGTLNARRVNIRTNPWIRPLAGSSDASSSSFSSTLLRDQVLVVSNKPVPPPKPQRKRPPLVSTVHQPLLHIEQEEDMDMVICSDKSVGTDGDEYLLEDGSSSSYCDCEDCCSSSCHSFSSLKLSSAGGFSYSSETIQPGDSDRCSITSTPTILNDFEYEDVDDDLQDEKENRDSAMNSPGSRVVVSMSASRRPHYSPADSHTSWKYFDDDDEVDSGHGQTASSLGSPGSAEDYAHHRVSHSQSSDSGGCNRMLVDETTEDIDTSIEIIRTRLQKQVYQLKHEQTALDRQMFRSRDYYNLDSQNMIEEDFMVQKKAILAETLSILKRQLDEQNERLRTSYSALQNLQKQQSKRQEPRNRDCRALSTLYNETLRETFC